MSLSAKSLSDTRHENTDLELEALLTSLVHYRRPKPDHHLDKNNKQIQHNEKIRKFGKKNAAHANISNEAAS